MIDLHRKLLGDRVRNEAFYEALKTVIVPGKTTVADIGSGTGFLSFLVLKLGAKSVVGYETGDIVEVSKKIAKVNGLRNCRFLHSHSTNVRNPEKVDVVVSETLGNFAYEENILESLGDARRMLKPGGTIIPARIEQFVCPVVSDSLYRYIDAWSGVGYDLDFSPAREVALNNMYVKTVRPDDLLPGAIKTWDSVDFSEKNQSVRYRTVQWDFGHSKKIVGQKRFCPTIYGFALWWKAELASTITLSTSPLDPPTHWEQIFLPLLTPLRIESGQSLALRIHSDSRLSVKIRVQWETDVRNAQGKIVRSLKQDMRKGHLN